MALNSDFKVKDSLYVGSSACFVSCTNTPVILSAGSSLFDIFLQEGEVSASCALTSGLGVDSFTFDGTADASVAVDGSVIDGIAEGTGQGQIAVTNLDNTTTQVNVHDMGVGDSPVFGNLTVTGLSATAANSGILSAGRDLNEIFVTSAEAGSVCSVTADVDSSTITVGGTSANPTVKIADTCVTLLSSAFCAAANDTNQGNIGLTRLNGGSATLDIGLCAGDNVQFVDICATGDIEVDGTVDGVDIAARDAVLTSTTTTAGNACTIASNALPKAGGQMTGNITMAGTETVDGVDISARDAVLTSTTTTATNACTIAGNALPKAGGQMTGNITFLGSQTVDGVDISARDAVLTSTTTTAGAALPCTGGAMTGPITTNSTFDGVDVAALATCSGLTCTGNVAGSGTVGKLTIWDGTTCLGDSILSQAVAGSNTTLTIGGSAIIQGDLTVTGDFTCLETLIETTSAVCIVNAGTGPALYAEQTGANQPIASFVDTEGGTITFDDGGKLGIGTASPSEKLTFVGNLSGIGNSTITGNSTIDGLATLGGGITATLGAGTSNTVVVSNGGSLVTDGIDSKVWACKVVDYGSSTGNKLARFCGTTGTLGNSNITDTGTLITLDSDVTVGNGDSIKIPATGGTYYAQEETFTATVGTTQTTVTTFNKTGLKSVKYFVTLIKGVNRTAFEVHAVYNDTDACGTVYAIIDAQAATQLNDVEVSVGASTIDLDITAASATTTAVIHGIATY
jgi:hypothetical protein